MNIFKSIFGGSDKPREENSREQATAPQEKSREQEKKDDDFDILKYDGVRAMHTGALDYALKCFRHALTIHDDLEIHDYLSRVYLAQGSLAEANEELAILSDAQPDNLEIIVRMARVAFMLEDYEQMDALCSRAAGIDGENPVVAFLTAQARRGQGDAVGALAQLTRAVALADDYGDAYLMRGQLLLEMGDADSADADAGWLLERVPDNEDALLLKARVERRRGQAESAIGYYTRVIDANPFHADAYRERGEVRMQQGDTIGATEDAEHALELNPDEAANVNGEYSAEGIEQKTRQAYRNSNPFGLG